MPRLTAKRPAAIALITILMVAVFALATITTVSMFSIGDLQMAGAETTSEQVFQAADGGIQDALYKLDQDSSYTGTYSPSGISPPVSVTVTNSGTLKHIVSEASGGGNVIRTLQINAHITSFGGFKSAVQSGVGGLHIENATVTGNVFSNGPINGDSGNSITGNVSVAGTEVVDKTNIFGDLHAYKIQNKSTISGNAYYNTIDGVSYNSTNPGPEPNKSTVHGSSCSASSNPQYCFPGAGPLATQPYPIPYDFYRPDDPLTPVIEGTLYKQALVGGTSPGDYVIDNSTGDKELGPLVISGDLRIKKGHTLTMTGTIWVEGNIVLEDPGNVVKLKSTYGPDSEAIVSQGINDMKNLATWTGSGYDDPADPNDGPAGVDGPKSVLLVISLSNASSAMNVRNNSNGAIFFAPFGKLELINGLNLFNATGNETHLNNSTSVTYKKNLQYINVAGNTNKVIVPDPNSWSEQ